MGRTSVFVTIAFLAGLGIGLTVRSTVAAAPQQQDTHAADLAAIEKLHTLDLEATLTQDWKGLLDIWTEDAVHRTEGQALAVQPILSAKEVFEGRKGGEAFSKSGWNDCCE